LILNSRTNLCATNKKLVLDINQSLWNTYQMKIGWMNRSLGILWTASDGPTSNRPHHLTFKIALFDVLIYLIVSLSIGDIQIVNLFLRLYLIIHSLYYCIKLIHWGKFVNYFSLTFCYMQSLLRLRHYSLWNQFR